MLRKCLLCLAAFLLLFTLAAAETAEEAAPAENPFIGVWQIAYYIHEGKLVTDPMTVEGGLPTMIEFHEETLTVHYPDGDHNEAACEYMGNTCSAWGGSSVFTLEGKDLIMFGFDRNQVGQNIIGLAHTQNRVCFAECNQSFVVFDNITVGRFLKQIPFDAVDCIV